MLKLATVFSGIGAIEQALKKQRIPHEIIFACDNGERTLKIDYDTIKEKVKDMDHVETKDYID